MDMNMKIKCLILFLYLLYGSIAVSADNTSNGKHCDCIANGKTCGEVREFIKFFYTDEEMPKAASMVWVGYFTNKQALEAKEHNRKIFSFNKARKKFKIVRQPIKPLDYKVKSKFKQMDPNKKS